MHDPGGEVGGHAGLCLPHRFGLLNGEIDKERAEQIERGEEIEIGGNAEMVGDGGRD